MVIQNYMIRSAASLSLSPILSRSLSVSSIRATYHLAYAIHKYTFIGPVTHIHRHSDADTDTYVHRVLFNAIRSQYFFSHCSRNGMNVQRKHETKRKISDCASNISHVHITLLYYNIIIIIMRRKKQTVKRTATKWY